MTKTLIYAIAMTVFFSLFVLPVYAEDVQITGLSANISLQKQRVTISGFISSGFGNEVTVKIMNPNGNLEYADQTTSTAEGKFEFLFVLSTKVTGVYRVYIGGYGVHEPAEVTFKYEKEVPEPVKDSTISPIEVSFDKNISKQTDIAISMTLNGNTLQQIKNGNAALTAGTDYIAAGSTVTIKKAYLAGLEVGGTALTFVFSAGSTASLEITIEDTTPAAYDSPSSGSSGGTSSTLSIAANSDGAVTVKPSIRLDSSGVAISTIDSNSLKKAFDAARADSEGSKIVNIELKKISGTGSYMQELPREALTTNENQKINIVTELGNILIPGNMLRSSDAQGAENIGISIAIADKSKLDQQTQSLIGTHPVIELNLLADGEKIEWSRPGVFIEVSIPYIPTAEELKDPEHIVVWYIDATGKPNSVSNGRYDSATGKVIFSTDHFSKYAVAYVVKTFSDIQSIQWARKPIEILASKGVINGVSEIAFAPENNITRADFLLLLIRTLGLDAEFEEDFEDVKPTDYYYHAIGVAKKLGITTGVGNNQYNPKAQISRQDMLTLSAKALKTINKLESLGSGSDLSKFVDSADISSYAVESIASLVRQGLIQGDGSLINPLSNTTRAETAVFMYRVYNLIIK